MINRRYRAWFLEPSEKSRWGTRTVHMFPMPNMTTREEVEAWVRGEPNYRSRNDEYWPEIIAIEEEEYEVIVEHEETYPREETPK